MLISRKLYSTAINFIKRITTYGDNQARDKLRRARVPELPNNYLRLDRTSLYHLAANLPTTVSRLTISRHLYKLRNFGTASAIVKTLDFSTLAPKDAIFVIQCLASSNAGVEADYKLQSLFRGCNFSFSENLIPTLCERIRFSGLAVDQKLEILRKLSHDIPQFPYTVAREAINWCDYTVKTQAGISCNVLDYVHENTSLKFFFRAIPHLKISGHHELVAGKLQDFYQCGHSGDFSLISALAEHVPDWLNDNDAIFARFVRDHLLRPTTLDLLGRLPKTDLVQALFLECVAAQNAFFRHASTLEQDAILRGFIRNELIKEATRLTDIVYLPDTVLPRLYLAGYRFLCDGNYQSAKDCFFESLEQDPSDNFAAMGLRFALPRTGKPMDAILEIRGRIGYGTRSFGRTGISTQGTTPLAELTSAFLMTGKYVEGLSTKRLQWASLKQHFGSKFLNYEPFPIDKQNSSLFVIGDDGVGDEIRAAQFYGQLVGKFKRIIISCDPRLANLFSVSFPSITFVPVSRRRKGLQTPIASNAPRLYGFTQKVADILTEECRPLLQSADLITLSQGLFYNFFAGHIKKPDPGPYLLSPKGRRLPNSANLRVGLLWRSHFSSTWRKLMYLSIQDFVPILALPGIEFWSIQHEIDEQERQFCRQHNIQLIEDVDLFNDFDGLATYLTSMDLLIGISSVPIELGAALGVPVWLLGFSPENYWLRTAGGLDEYDRFTMNSIVIGPSSKDFSASRDTCCLEVFSEVRRRLENYRNSRGVMNTLVATG